MMDSDNDRPQVSRSEGDKQAGQLPDLESANAPTPTTPNVLARLGLENNALPSEETEEQLRLALTDPAWYMRAAAVQILACAYSSSVGIGSVGETSPGGTFSPCPER